MANNSIDGHHLRRGRLGCRGSERRTCLSKGNVACCHWKTARPDLTQWRQTRPLVCSHLTGIWCDSASKEDSSHFGIGREMWKRQKSFHSEETLTSPSLFLSSPSIFFFFFFGEILSPWSHHYVRSIPAKRYIDFLLSEWCNVLLLQLFVSLLLLLFFNIQN